MDRVERIARAMCMADGDDPDKLIGAGMETVPIGSSGSERREKAVHNWTSYERQARLFLAALDAVQAEQ